MMPNTQILIYYLTISIVPVMLGMILHEIAHGWVAWKMGDSTARDLGRLTLNPIPHLDPLGTLFFVLTAFAASKTGAPFIFGWAKPVPIDPRRFRNLRQGLIAVSLAGAMANLLLAFAFTLITHLLHVTRFIAPMARPLSGDSMLLDICTMGIYVNCTLAWFNLMPIPPLDGSKVLGSLLPRNMVRAYFSLERYGMIIVLLLLATGVLGKIIRPLVLGSINVFAKIVAFIF